MKNSICGGCVEPEMPSVTPQLVSTRIQLESTLTNAGLLPALASNTQKHILERSIECQKSASQHRLNQPSAKQNASLQAATAKKETLSALKKQSRTDTISVTAMLNVFPLKGAVKKACIISPFFAML